MKDLNLEPRKTTVKLLVIHNFINGDQQSHDEGGIQGVDEIIIIIIIILIIIIIIIIII
jgi:hypothetical protein